MHHRYQGHGWQICHRCQRPAAANFATGTTGVVDTGGKFATSVNDTGGKFAAIVNDTCGNLPPVLLTPVANNGNNIRLQTP